MTRNSGRGPIVAAVAAVVAVLAVAAVLVAVRNGGARQASVAVRVGGTGGGSVAAAAGGGTHVDLTGTGERGPAAGGRIGIWSAALTRGGPTFTGTTLRMVVHTSAAGSRLRIRLSDVAGGSPLRVGAADVAVQEYGARAYPGTHHTVTFGGARGTVIAEGTERASDIVPMKVAAGRNLLVSLYLPGTNGPAAFHREAYQTAYLSADGRDHAGDTAPGAFTGTSTSWYYLTGLDVVSATVRGTVVAFGDSITDGYHSTADANRRWPDQLARRLAAEPGGQRLGVVDAGIAGNRLLSRAPQIYRGPAGVQRFAHDALAQPGVKDVIVLEGVNDLSNDVNATGGPLTAQDLIAGYRTVIAEAHAAGVRAVGATILPYSKLDPAMEAVRTEVNDWIRTSHAFDAVADFDLAVRDPAHPSAMRPQYDSGDHLHPDDAGMLAMADVVDLATLAS